MNLLARSWGDVLGIACAIAVMMGAVPGLDGAVVNAVALFVLLLSAWRIVLRVHS